ncbi:MAG: DUF484 domain-containing protein [Enterobacteriaceae bacterium]
MRESKTSNGDNLTQDEQDIVDYLCRHPDFFIRHAHSVEHLMIPHPVRGAVSLPEWQLARQRQQIEHLQEEITLLMEAAAANETLFAQLLKLYAELALADSLQSVLERLRTWSRSLGLTGVALRLFTEQWSLQAPSSFHHLGLSRQQFEPIRIQRMGDLHHYLGQLNRSELQLLLPESREAASVAMSLLGEQGDLGVLIFSSRDAGHYQPQQGTLLLQHLSQWLPGLLTRWIART